MLLVVCLIGNLLAASTAAQRGFGDSRSAHVHASAVLFFAAMVLPVWGLGWCGLLTRPALLTASALTYATLLSVGLCGRQPKRRALRALSALKLLCRAPWDAMVVAAGQRSAVAVGLAVTALGLAWTAYLCWLAPAWGWDGLWYHDSMVGFALQAHGFDWVHVDPTKDDFVNGYPKAAEALSMWMVLLCDRRLIELPNTLASGLLLVSVYAAARPLVASRVSALGAAVTLLLVPGVLLQLRSTYIDLIFLAWTAAAVAPLLRSPFRVRDMALVGLCAGLVGASKASGIVVAPALLGALTVRGLWAVRLAARGGAPKQGAVQKLLGLLFAFCVCTCLAAPTYARNYLRHDNPVWPVRLHKPGLGISWDGPAVVGHQLSAQKFWASLSSPPRIDLEFHDTRKNGYGNLEPWLVWPLGALGLVLACLQTWRRRRCPQTSPRAAAYLLLVSVPLLIALAVSPALWWARLNLHGVLAVHLLAHYCLGGPGWERTLDSVQTALLACGLLVWSWSSPGWGVSLLEARELAALSWSERNAFPLVNYVGPPPVLRARDSELTADTVAAFGKGFHFISLLWNDEFSNRVVFVPFESPSAFTERLAQLEARWCAVRRGSPEARTLTRAADWQLVGKLWRHGVAYRRSAQAPGIDDNAPGASVRVDKSIRPEKAH